MIGVIFAHTSIKKSLDYFFCFSFLFAFCGVVVFTEHKISRILFASFTFNMYTFFSLEVLISAMAVAQYVNIFIINEAVGNFERFSNPNCFIAV